MVIFLPLAVCIIGACMYRWHTNAKWAEVGRIMFTVGLLVCLWSSFPEIVAYVGRGSGAVYVR